MEIFPDVEVSCMIRLDDDSFVVKRPWDHRRYVVETIVVYRDRFVMFAHAGHHASRQIIGYAHDEVASMPTHVQEAIFRCRSELISEGFRLRQDLEQLQAELPQLRRTR